MLCYNFRRPRHITKECPGTGPIFLCCKSIGHEVEDCPWILSRVEKMNMRQEKYEVDEETKDMLENQKESETMLL